MATATAASTCSSSPSGARGLEAALELLGDEAGRQRALAPARVLHQRGQERDVVLDAVDDEGIERVGLQRRWPPRASAAWVTSLAIIGS